MIFLPVALCADLARSLSLSERTELRVRVVEAANAREPSGPPVVAFEAAMTPRLSLETRSRQARVGITYAPQLTLSITPAQRIEVLHTAQAWAAWRGSHVRVLATEDVSYGDVNYTYLAPSAPGAPAADAPRQLIPAGFSLLRGSSRTALFMAAEPTRRLSFFLTPSFSIGGGMDDASRAILPVQTTPRLDASLAYAATGRDRVGPELVVWATRSPPRPCEPETGGTPAPVADPPTCASRVEGAEWQLFYERALSRRASLRAAGGAAVVRTRLDADAPARVTLYPEGSFGLGIRSTEEVPRDAFDQLEQTSPEGAPRRGRKPDRWNAVALGLAARFAPVVDARYVEPDPRVSGSATVTWQHGRITTTAVVTADRSTPPTNISAIAVGGAAGVVWRWNERFEVGGGVRGAWQHEPAIGSLFSVVVSAVFVLREPALAL